MYCLQDEWIEDGDEDEYRYEEVLGVHSCRETILSIAYSTIDGAVSPFGRSVNGALLRLHGLQ